MPIINFQPIVHHIYIILSHSSFNHETKLNQTCHSSCRMASYIHTLRVRSYVILCDKSYEPSYDFLWLPMRESHS